MDTQVNTSGRSAFDNDASSILQANFGMTNFNHDFGQSDFNWQTSHAPPLDNFMSTQDPLEGFFAQSLNQASQHHNGSKAADSEQVDENSGIPTSIVDPALVFNGATSSYTSPSKGSLKSHNDSFIDGSNQTNGLGANGKLEDTNVNKQTESRSIDMSRENYSSFANNFKGSNLRRSNTDGAVKRRSLALDSRLASTLSREPDRRASPLKTNGNGALGSIPEISRPRSRASVVLTVDEHGNARTETRLTSDRSVDSQYGQKYSGLWDDTESDSEPEVHSSSQSFLRASSSRPRRNSSKSRATNSHAETLGVLTSSTSNNGLSAACRARQRLNRTISDASRRYSTPSSNKCSREAPSVNRTEGLASAEKANSAQAALKQSKDKDSRKRRSSKSNRFLNQL